MGNKLTEIAADLKRRARIGAPARFQLGGGLWLQYALKDFYRRQLSMTRADVEPSRKEVETCRRDFDIPADALRESARQTIGETTYYTVRLIWRQPQQLTLIEDEDKAVAVLNYDTE